MSIGGPHEVLPSHGPHRGRRHRAALGDAAGVARRRRVMVILEPTRNAAAHLCDCARAWCRTKLLVRLGALIGDAWTEVAWGLRRAPRHRAPLRFLAVGYACRLPGQR